MRRTVIADTTCFIVLSEINELEILRSLYTEIYTTKVIAEEFGEPLPQWVIVSDPTDDENIRILSQLIDSGEASAIALAIEHTGSLLIVDDQKGRIIAGRYGLSITGTLGVLLSAKRAGVVVSLRSLIQKIRKTNFYLSDDIVDEVLRLSGE